MIAHADLGDVVSYIRGITFKPDDKIEPSVDGAVVCMRTSNVQRELDESDLIAVPQSFVRRSELFLKRGDILLSSANSWNLVGKCCFVPELDYSATAGGFISIVRAKDDVIDQRYLYRWLSSGQVQQAIRHLGRQTTNISNLPVDQFLGLEIPLPPLPEQKRIAAILDKADAIRRKRQQAIELADQFLRSVFLDLFGDPVTNPKGWDQVKLGKHCGVGSSKRVFVEEFVDAGIPFYRGTEIGQLGDGKVIEPHLFIARDHYEALREHSGAPQAGDLLLPSICHDGRIWKVETDQPFYFKDGRVLWIKVDHSEFNSDYLRSFLSFVFSARYASIASGTTFAELKIVNLKQLFVLQPPLALQEKYSKIVAKANVGLYREKQGLDVVGRLFDSLSQRAFSGEM